MVCICVRVCVCVNVVLGKKEWMPVFMRYDYYQPLFQDSNICICFHIRACKWATECRCRHHWLWCCHYHCHCHCQCQCQCNYHSCRPNLHLYSVWFRIGLVADSFLHFANTHLYRSVEWSHFYVYTIKLYATNDAADEGAFAVHGCQKYFKSLERLRSICKTATALTGWFTILHKLAGIYTNHFCDHFQFGKNYLQIISSVDKTIQCDCDETLFFHFVLDGFLCRSKALFSFGHKMLFSKEWHDLHWVHGPQKQQTIWNITYLMSICRYDLVYAYACVCVIIHLTVVCDVQNKW